MVQRLGAGHFLDDLNDALAATADEVVATGKPGTVTIKLTVSTKSPGDPMVMVDEAVSRASPKKDAKGALFFAVAGALHREDPRQVRMEFREVNVTTGELRDVPSEREERGAT